LAQEAGEMKFDWTEGALAEGLTHYRAGEFFAAHESWESLWLVAQEPDKMFLQGLIQVTAAFHHLQRNNPLGAARLFGRALKRLEPYPADYGSVSVTVLCEDLREWIKALELGTLRPLGPVRIANKATV
jgi:predicted metal-dependent hydrolase